MQVIVDTDDFCIRMYNDVAYMKVMGMQDEDSVAFFSQTIDEMLEQYPHTRFASVCDLTQLILSDPKTARKINKAIRKISTQLDYKFNAVIVKRKFLPIVQGYIFSFYMQGTGLKTKLFFARDEAIMWVEKKGFDLSEIKEFLQLRS